MDLFVGNLPPNTNIGELIAFFKGFSSKGDFHLKKKTLDNGETVFYAVIGFENDKYALKLMEKFAGQSFKGRELVIREYFHRSYNNERRAVNWREKPWRAGERRRQDRRLKESVQQRDEFEDILASSKEKEKEQSLDEKAASLKIQAYDNFARKN